MYGRVRLDMGRVDDVESGWPADEQFTGGNQAKRIFIECAGLQAITPATPHVVVWPVEKPLLSADALDERRHWHTACWTRRH